MNTNVSTARQRYLLHKLSRLTLPNGYRFRRKLTTAVLAAAIEYEAELSPAAFAAAVRSARKTGDLAVIEPYLPARMPAAPRRITPCMPLQQGSKKGNLSLPPNKIRRAMERLVVGGSFVLTRGGKRRVWQERLLGQIKKGHPGRELELILVSRLASIWAGAGGAVVLNTVEEPSLFETFVGDVLCALEVDVGKNPRNLVRLHIQRRRALFP